MKEYDTREKAFAAAVAEAGLEVRLDEERSRAPGVRAVYTTDDPEVYINDLGARFEVCSHGVCRNFNVQEKYTADEVRRRVCEAWGGIKAIDEVISVIDGLVMLPSDARATALRGLRASRATLLSQLMEFVPIEAMNI